MKERIYNLIFHLLYFIIYRKKIEGQFYRSKLKGTKDNKIKIGELHCSSLVIKGNSNQIETNGSRIHDSSITIDGSGNRITIKPGVRIFKAEIQIRGNDCEFFIGENTNILADCRFVCQGNKNFIKIGENSLFSRDIQLWNSDTHTIRDNDGNILNYSQPIEIGNNVWVGRHVTVLKGVNIGDGSIVGMMSLVTKDIPKHSIAVGSPAKVVRENINWSQDFVY